MTMNKALILLLMAAFTSGCDPDRHRQCEWYLVPEPDHIQLVEKGWVSLCARNYHNNKQRCFLQAKLDFSEQVYGKAFRFTSLELDDSYPNKVKSITVCTPESKPKSGTEN